jgi:mannan endo-1,4-beta-mannosidase
MNSIKSRNKYLGRYGVMITCAVFAIGFAAIGMLKETVSRANNLPPNNQFYIVGTKIIDPQGKVFIPIGANVGMQPNNFDWAGGAAGHSTEAQAWGWNTVRLTVDCTTALPWSRVNAQDGDAVLISEIDNVVKEYTGKHMVVMIECHDTMLNPNDAANFWSDVATKYKANPYVWFNYANEPYWSENDAWLASQKQWLALVRSKGAENIFVADAMNLGNDATWDGAKNIFDPTMGPSLASGQCNVLMSLHNYGGRSNSENYIVETGPYDYYFQAVQNAGLAMIIGEYGLDYRLDFANQSDGSVKIISTTGEDPKTLAGDAYNHFANGEYTTMHLAKNYGIGMLAWHGTHADTNRFATPIDGITVNGQSTGKVNFYNILNSSLTGALSGFTFTRQGRDLWDAGHSQPASVNFTGNYADSKCASTTSSSPATPSVDPIVLQPIGSTPSVPAVVPKLSGNQILSPSKSQPNSALAAGYAANKASGATKPGTSVGGSTTNNTPSGSVPAAPKSTNGAIAQSQHTQTTKTSSSPLIKIAGQQVSARQIGVYGSIIFGAILLFVTGFHFVSLFRARKLAAHYNPTGAFNHPPASSKIPDSAKPGDVITPQDHQDVK